MELLQLSNGELEERVKSELEENPALAEEEPSQVATEMTPEYRGYEQITPFSSAISDKETHVASHQSLQEQLHAQLGFLALAPNQVQIGQQIIGSLDADGYLRRPFGSISIDLRKTGLQVAISEIATVLNKIQSFDPPGIAARDLQECLLLQLAQQPAHPHVGIAQDILAHHYENFTKKHFTQIAHKLKRTEEEIREGLRVIQRLNPKPGNSMGTNQPAAVQQLPDFILHEKNNTLSVQLQYPSVRNIHVSSTYTKLLQGLQSAQAKKTHHKETIVFIQKKIEAARSFLQALHQRKETLLSTARMIVKKQRAFMHSGDPMHLKPLVLKNVAQQLQVDISTISRIVNNKRIQTPFGIFSLRYFFSQSISKTGAEQVSNRVVKTLLQQIVENEDKKQPLSDENLQGRLQRRGYTVARRTVTKYREQLHIPVARMRKSW